MAVNQFSFSAAALDRHVTVGNSRRVARTRSVSGDVNLLLFLQSLYDNGASGGDFAVIRLNPDVDKDPDGSGTPRIGSNHT